MPLIQPFALPGRCRVLSGLPRLLAITTLALVGLVSCQGGGETNPTATLPPPVVSETAVPGMEGIRLRPVTWTTGIDPGTGEPIDRVEVFPRDTDTIYAAFEVVMNVPEGGMLTARWEINGRPVEGLAATIEIDAAQPAGWAEFHLDWEGPTMWPVGTLRIVITSSAGETLESSVEIE